MFFRFEICKICIYIAENFNLLSNDTKEAIGCKL